MDVTVIVATFGGHEWRDLARTRAIPSAEAAGAPVVHAHGPTLHEARNRGAASCSSEWLCFLDADDELDPRYFAAIARSSADLRAPAVSYITAGRRHRPRIPRVAGHQHDCQAECLPFGNWLVVGSPVRRDIFDKAGGWEPWPLYEDWALWLRCWHAGATIERVPDAIYRAHVRPASRNRAPSTAEKNRIHRKIAAAILPEQAAA